MLDFLFASQDASTASLCWVIYFLHKYPDVRARVVEEQKKVRPNNEAVTTDLLSQMTYTRQVGFVFSRKMTDCMLCLPGYA